MIWIYCEVLAETTCIKTAEKYIFNNRFCHVYACMC